MKGWKFVRILKGSYMGLWNLDGCVIGHSCRLINRKSKYYHVAEFLSTCICNDQEVGYVVLHWWYNVPANGYIWGQRWYIIWLIIIYDFGSCWCQLNVEIEFSKRVCVSGYLWVRSWCSHHVQADLCFLCNILPIFEVKLWVNDAYSYDELCL